MKFSTLSIFAAIAAFLVGSQFVVPTAVFATGVIGTGTAASCTDAALTKAIASGGSITFNCGSAPVSIQVRSPKTISIVTVINGNNLITLDGGGQSYFFYV